jgi:hypothetical protein
MFRRLRRALPLVALATLASAGCETTTSPPNEDPPDPINLSFTGTLTLNSSAIHRFTAGAGEINVRLKVLAPVESVVIGMALGVWTGASCNIVIADDNAVFNALLIGTATASGEFCARMYDAGKLTDVTNYQIDVTHF